MECWAVDAGGSGTTVMIDGGERWRCGSVNPASVGPAAAEEQLASLFSELAERLGPRPAFGWLATATVDAGAPEPELSRLAGAATAAGLAGTLVISRDIVPLLAARPLRGRGVAVVCGTGSGFLAGDGAAAPVSVGGCEYLGSDEGSAFDIGLTGLRAAVRGADGRGRPTLLAEALTGRHGVSGGTVAELSRALAARSFPKAAVAALAPEVCRCWLDGDPVAAEVIGRAIGELVAGARAARDRAGLAGGTWSAVLSGGVPRGCAEFGAELARRISAELGAAAFPAVVDDPTRTVLSAARTYRGRFPDFLAGRWAWPRRLGGGR
ncbi:BadF-type ATPase [Actinacidiphila yanglinensis]|uniref:BadF-type ATPase n=1 Tax=Actinacidiphila yanglinensis TaxID=310779 RepID=A0A1H5TZP7_9ACTN|nr:BadF/BadG/BcrA/BcrD ATPase family protein [Actinacidiphila yanglinensis]SEF67481.1 BadF-type ATPase [Actinacidiphila yanglinensis]